jgi:hypothetical protein
VVLFGKMGRKAALSLIIMLMCIGTMHLRG